MLETLDVNEDNPNEKTRILHLISTTPIQYSVSDASTIYNLFKRHTLVPTAEAAFMLNRRTTAGFSAVMTHAICNVLPDRGRTQSIVHIFDGPYADLKEHLPITGDPDVPSQRQKILRASCIPTGVFAKILAGGDYDVAQEHARLWFRFDCLEHLVDRIINVQHNVIFGEDTEVKCQPTLTKKEPQKRAPADQDVGGGEADHEEGETPLPAPILLTDVFTVCIFYCRSTQFLNMFRARGPSIYRVNDFSALVDFEKNPKLVDVCIAECYTHARAAALVALLYLSDSLKEEGRFDEDNLPEARREVDAAIKSAAETRRDSLKATSITKAPKVKSSASARARSASLTAATSRKCEVMC